MIKEINASVESVLSGNPIVFSSDNKKIYIALDGLVFPYRIFIVVLTAKLHKIPHPFTYVHDIDGFTSVQDIDSVNIEMNKINKDVPREYREQFKNSPVICIEHAVQKMINKICADNEKPNAALTQALRDLEERYADLYFNE